MPIYAVNQDGLLVNALDCGDCVHNTYFCHECNKQLRYHRSSSRSNAYFQHVETSSMCTLFKGSVDTQIEITTRTTNDMSSWHKEWQKLCNDHSKIEARNVGPSKRPRDIGDAENNTIIEFQHSLITNESFKLRNTGVHALWIFDATDCTLWSYANFADNVFFCEDTFKQAFEHSEDVNVLFHCIDGNLYESIVSEPITLTIDNETKYVRLLKNISDECKQIMDVQFDTWPLKLWENALPPKRAILCNNPVHVKDIPGQTEFDKYHRDFFFKFPTQHFTIITAPPGSGKSTALKEAVNRWKDKKILYIVFNKPNQECMEKEFKKYSHAHCRTLDSLCFRACGSPNELDVKFSDQSFIYKYWPNTSKSIGAYCAKLKKYGGKRSSDIVKFRLRHPRATYRICRFHQNLGRKGECWTAEHNSYPLNKIINNNATFTACRYNCDIKDLLKPLLDQYDIILVDEMQDLLSGQELRLVQQTTKPIVFIGDRMQAINNFRDEVPCEKCEFDTETIPNLPVAFEWYGTWRLDPFTAKFIEERFKRSMYSYQMNKSASTIKWQTDLQNTNTLIMCRSNQSVVSIMQTFQDIHVVNGKDLSTRLQDAAKDDTMTTPLAKLARELYRQGMIEDICEQLQSRSVSLYEVVDIPVVSTVHQIKGFEYDHCAVHKDLLNPENDAERNISFVAFTRHKKSLTVLC